MDLVDRIDTTRFLGSEFLTWLWFKIELFEGSLALGEEPIGEHRSCDVWLDTQVVLASWTDDSEKATLRGAAPSSTPEAAEALKQGKIPQKVALRLMLGTEEYAFTFNAKPFSVSGVKLPQVLKEESDEAFLERMRLLEQLDDVIGALYEEFLLFRLSPLWEAELLPGIRAWVKGVDGLSPQAYAALLDRAQRAHKDSRKGSSRKKAS